MKKQSIIALCLSIILSLSFIFAYIMDNSEFKKIDKSNLIQNDNNNNISIENINITDNYVQISGWAIDKNQTYDYYNWASGKGSSVYNNTTIVLQDSDNTLYQIHTVSQKRDDINKKINDGIDYRNCGIQAVVKLSKLQKNQNYKIGVIIKNLDGNEKLIMSDKEIQL